MRGATHEYFKQAPSGAVIFFCQSQNPILLVSAIS